MVKLKIYFFLTSVLLTKTRPHLTVVHAKSKKCQKNAKKKNNKKCQKAQKAVILKLSQKWTKLIRNFEFYSNLVRVSNDP